MNQVYLDSARLLTRVAPLVLVDDTFALKGGNYCFDPEGDETEVCWTVNRPGAEGSFTATNPDGHTVTLTRRVATAAPAAAETNTM